MNKTDALVEHQVFIRQFVALYKQSHLLWQQNHPQYRNKAARAAALKPLIQKAQEYYPEADEDFVRMKIESMRACFRKERKKVLRSKELSDNPLDIHKPSLWYYDLMLFTVGEEPEESSSQGVKVEEDLLNSIENGNLVKTPFWSREQSAILIKFYKNHPCLYSTSHPFYRNKRRRNDAIKKITEKLMATTGKSFIADDVKKKISLIRSQFLYEYKKIKSSEEKGEHYKPNLWCFEMLNFLMEEYTSNKKTSKKDHLRGRKDSTSEESEDDVDVKKESDGSLSPESYHMDTSQSMEDEDIFDTIAKNLAHQLRDMTNQQRTIANKIIREVMYRGQMEQLTEESRLSVDGN